ncbi:exported hypothetical protein [Candidatus Sulfotelmatobacter sp. SbA7]|nr:exported hypothetical protein [Candidatus Sulfotelmatobacter sp. SbA7]
MDKKLWLMALCLLALILVAVGQKSSPKPEPVGSSRYQLVPAQVLEESEPLGRLFLVDVQDGRVWKYQSGFKTNKGDSFPDTFTPVAIGIPTEGVPGYGLKKSASDSTGH